MHTLLKNSILKGQLFPALGSAHLPARHLPFHILY